MLAACANGPPVTEEALLPALVVHAPERSQGAPEPSVMQAPAPHRPPALEGMRLAGTGTPCTSLELAGRNHFDVVFELGEPASPLFAAARALFG